MLMFEKPFSLNVSAQHTIEWICFKNKQTNIWNI